MQFSDKVVQWQACHGRHHLPWQQNISPYKTWVSEVMLQQTTVRTVLDYFEPFVNRFPDIPTLAQSDLESVLSYWAGLGYYRRARYLHQGARYIADHHNSTFPESYDEMIKIPGIGASTAGAIRSLAFDQNGVILDGNVKRVLTRHIGIKTPINQPSTMKQLWQHAHTLAPTTHHRSYSQGMMDLGATVCHKQSPHCSACPLHKTCWTHQHNAYDTIPAKNIKKKVKTMRLQPVVITNGNTILLEKQASDGLWADMWMLPNFCQHQHPHIHPLPAFQHVLTHFRISVEPLIVYSNEVPITKNNQRWTTIDDADTPTPKIVDKCVQLALAYMKKNPS